MTAVELIIGCYVIAMIFGVVALRPQKKEKEQFVPTNSYETLINILNASIQREIQYKNDMDYRMRDVRVIYDFTGDLKQVTQRIMESLSPSFMKELEYYHSREYIVKHVTRSVELFLIEYTKTHKPKITKMAR